MRAWRTIDRFEGRSCVTSWLYRIASNACIDMLRAPQRRARRMDLGPSSTVQTAVLAPQAESTFVPPMLTRRWRRTHRGLIVVTFGSSDRARKDTCASS